MTRISDLPDNGSLPVQQMPPQMQSQQQPPQMNGGAPGGSAGFDPNTYMPMNIHPNPYGISAQLPGGLPMPQQPQKPMNGGESYMNNGGGGGTYPVGGPNSGPAAPAYTNGPSYTNGPAYSNGPSYPTAPQNQFISQEHANLLQNMPQHRLPSRDIPMDTAGYVQDEEIKVNYVPPAKLSSDYVREYEQTTDKKIKEYEDKKKREKVTESWFDEFQWPVFVSLLFFIFHLPIINTMIFKRFSFLSIYNADGNFNIYGLILKSILFGSVFYMLHSIIQYVSDM